MTLMRTIGIASLMILASACASESPWTPPSEVLSVQRCSGHVTNDPYALGDVTFDGELLLVNLQASGGCKAHSFSICWSGVVGLSLPPWTALELSHNANGDACEALQHFDLRVDVSGLVQQIAPPIVVSISGGTSQLDGTSGAVFIEH